MSDGLSESDIVQGLRRGDRDAWDALCQQYSGHVWRYVARLIGRDAEVVADVFQETMLAVAKAGRGISEDTKLWAWLARISQNQAALYWRKRYRDRAVKLDADALTAKSEDGPLDALTRMETVDTVRGLLAEMSSDHVVVLTAKYTDGLSVSDIVEAIGGTTEAVRSRLARARRDFRERFERLSSRHGETERSAVPDISKREGERDEH